MSHLDERDVPADPFALFATWFAEAEADPGTELPEAAALATSSAEGRPGVRMVLARHEDGGFRFFTNHNSPKGQDLEANPRAAMAFWWGDRQVTAGGQARRLSEELSDAYWLSRPRPAQLSAAASPQSQPVPARESLTGRVAELARTYGDEPVPRPAHWGGYELVPDEIVFWQHREDRLHDRVRYTRAGEGWRIERLAP